MYQYPATIAGNIVFQTSNNAAIVEDGYVISSQWLGSQGGTE
jgi:hypothetical protein